MNTPVSPCGAPLGAVCRQRYSCDGRTGWNRVIKVANSPTDTISYWGFVDRMDRVPSEAEVFEAFQAGGAWPHVFAIHEHEAASLVANYPVWRAADPPFVTLPHGVAMRIGIATDDPDVTFSELLLESETLGLDSEEAPEFTAACMGALQVCMDLARAGVDLQEPRCQRALVDTFDTIANEYGD